MKTRFSTGIAVALIASAAFASSAHAGGAGWSKLSCTYTVPNEYFAVFSVSGKVGTGLRQFDRTLAYLQYGSVSQLRANTPSGTDVAPMTADPSVANTYTFAQDNSAQNLPLPTGPSVRVLLRDAVLGDVATSKIIACTDVTP